MRRARRDTDKAVAAWNTHCVGGPLPGGWEASLGKWTTSMCFDDTSEWHTIRDDAFIELPGGTLLPKAGVTLKGLQRAADIAEQAVRAARIVRRSQRDLTQALRRFHEASITAVEAARAENDAMRTVVEACRAVVEYADQHHPKEES